MGCPTKVTIAGGGARVTVQGGSAARVTIDRRTAAVIADRRPQTITQPKNTAVDVTSRATTVRAGAGMGVQGPKGEPGTDVGSHPTISAESAEAAPMLRGTPVALVDGKLRRASAIPPFNAVVGLVFEAQIAPGEAGRVQTDGPMEMLQSEWEAVTGIPGSLAAEATYYLSPAGSMSPWAPTAPGQVVAPVGRAASATEFVIDIDTQVHL